MDGSAVGLSGQGRPPPLGPGCLNHPAALGSPGQVRGDTKGIRLCPANSVHPDLRKDFSHVCGEQFREIQALEEIFKLLKMKID